MNVPKYPTIVNPQAPDEAQYHQGRVLTNGAQSVGYRKPVQWPLFTLWGPGVVVHNQFNSVQSEQLEYSLALTQAPIYGAGVPAGSIQYQQLLEDDNGN